MANDQKSLLKVNDLKTYFPVKRGFFQKTVGHIKAVDGISFDVRKGSSFGLVGESGCGKTTAARTIIHLEKATAGNVYFQDRDILRPTRKDLRDVRKNISLIFQDPFGSLNPRMTVANIVGEPIKVARGLTGQKLLREVTQLLERVGLSSAYLNRYPHEFSGGQRQRIGIARALSLNPKLIICDEPVSALDVSIQSQILNLLKDLQDEFDLTYLFIAHDLAVVEFFCDEIAVMYMGKIVEKASAEELYKNPLHPYTKVLMSAIPKVDTNRRGKKVQIGGEVPSIMNKPAGCPFHTRCSISSDKCPQKMPPMEQVEGIDHFVSCWNWKLGLD